MKQLIQLIRQESQNIFEQVVGFREHLHKNPELSFEEHDTAAYIASVLAGEGIAFEPGIAGTGLVGVVQGKNTGKIVALRGDMDALPIQELNEVPYRSLKAGVMHACGHDVHSASLLGSVIILHRLREQLPGSVKFIFQPGEEKLPGGASLMIKAGVLKEPDVASIFGQHVFPELEAGKVGFRRGMYMASTDEIYMTVKGRGGHGAMPHQVVDTVLIMAQIIVGLQQIVSRKADPNIPTVLSFGKVDAPGATNVIPSTVKIEGTFRTFDEHWRNEAHQLIVAQAMNIAKSLGGECEVEICHGYPSLVNHEGLTDKARLAAEEYLGKENVVELPIRTTAEDFAFYSHQVPACFYRLGVGNEARGIVHGVHHPRFDIDPDALKIAPGLMAWLAVSELNS